MRSRHHMLLAVALICLAGCAVPPLSDAERVRCVEIPHGLVECHEVSPADARGGRAPR